MPNSDVIEMTLVDALEVFGVDGSRWPITEDELKKLYKELAKKNHPDMHPSEETEKWKKVMAKINQAKDRLERAIGDEEKLKINDSDEAGKSEIKKCRVCHGTGKMNKIRETAYGSVIEKVKCEYCRGTGRK